ncbi:MAG: DNA polymerase III subunit epsilon [Pseudomonadota bacterium]|nr:DNA polymerase III subunit epsilon [Pseudomonadota bacterium]
MRLVVLDTETTGLDPAQGHRVIEVAAVELLGRQLSGRHFQRYLNPDRDIDPGAQEVHGLSREFLADKPRFPDVVDELLDFLRDATLVIHNAPFDLGFLDHELRLCGRAPLTTVSGPTIDTLLMARDQFPGKRNSLDALCERFDIDNSRRTYHGALLDTELLAEVYLAMTRGQESLMMELEPAAPAVVAGIPGQAAAVRVLQAATIDAAEQAEHARLLLSIDKASKGQCLWLQRYAPADVG